MPCMRRMVNLRWALSHLSFAVADGGGNQRLQGELLLSNSIVFTDQTQ